MIRELFVELGEAAVAAIKAAADEHKPTFLVDAAPYIAAPPPPLWVECAREFLEIMQTVVGDRTLRMARAADRDEVIFSHRCKLCNKRHSIRISEQAMLAPSPGSQQFADLLYSEVEALLQRPCEIELGKKT